MPTSQTERELRARLSGRREALLARLRQSADLGREVASTPIGPTVFPLSYTQKFFVQEDRSASGSIFYHLPLALHIFSAISVPDLRRALQLLVKRHPALSTLIQQAGDELSQRVAPDRDVDFAAIDAGSWSWDELMSQVEAANRVSLDFRNGPIFRARLFTRTPTEHVLLLSIHHIQCDGYSMSVMAYDLGQIYQALRSGEPDNLPALTVTYADFVAWQQQMIIQDKQRAGEFWRARLANLPRHLGIPTDFPRPPVRTYRGDSAPLLLSQPFVAQLRELAEQEGTTLYMLLLAAYFVLLHRYTGRDDLLVGTPVSGRTQADFAHLVGSFANTLLMRGDLSGNPPFRTLLRQVREMVLASMDFQHYPLGVLLEEDESMFGVASSQLFPLLLSLDGAHRREMVRPSTAGAAGPQLRLGSWLASVLQVRNLEGASEVQMHLREHAGQLMGAVRYDVSLFTPQTAARIADHFQGLLAGILRDPEQRAWEIPLMGHSAQKMEPVFLLTQLTQALLASPQVYDGCVLLRRTETFGPKAVAYFVPAHPFTLEELKAHLSLHLPEEQLPYAYTPLSALPLTQNGEIDCEHLATLPVLDHNLLMAWSAAMDQALAIKQVPVMPRLRLDSDRPYHITELPPAAHSLRPPARKGEAKDAPAPAGNSKRLDAESRVVAAGTPAVAEGPALQADPRAPRTLDQALLRTAARFGGKGMRFVLTDDHETELTYQSLLQEARSILAGLRAAGLDQGDRVILQLASARDHLPAFWGCLLGGIVPVTVAVPPVMQSQNQAAQRLRHVWRFLGHAPILAPAILKSDLARFLDEAGAPSTQVLILSALQAADPAQELARLHPQDTAFLQLTSGSTGRPKCIRETHASILAHIRAVIQNNGYSSDHVTVNWLPMDHVVPLIQYHLKDLYLGCDQVHVATDWVLGDPLRWLDVMESHRATHTWSPNFGYKLVSDALARNPQRTWDLSSIQLLDNGGEQVTRTVIQEFMQRTAPFQIHAQAMQPSYGMAEVGTGIVYQLHYDGEHTVHRVRKRSLQGPLEFRPVGEDGAEIVEFVDLGPPIPGARLRIVDAQQQILPEGCIGRLQMQGPMVTPGYLENASANGQAFTEDGWFDSGDLAFLLNGSLAITGRASETIVVRGVNVYCHDIEDVVNSVPGVEPTYAAACGALDGDEGTEALIIFFTPHSLSPELGREIPLALLAAIRSQVSTRMGIAPAHVLPLPRHQFPKTTSGKIQRNLLAQGFADGQFDELIREVDRMQGNDRTVPRWFYGQRWLPRTLETEIPAPAGNGPALIFADAAGLGEALARRLAEQGEQPVLVRPAPELTLRDPRAFAVRPDEPDHYHQLLDRLADEGQLPARIYHLWTYSPDPQPPGALAELLQAQTLGVYSLLYLIQALTKVGGRTREVSLFAVSSGLQAVEGEAPAAFAHAPILGLLRTAAQETPWLHCRHVDLAGPHLAQQAEFLLQESQFLSQEAEAVYRNGQRLVSRLEAVDMASQPPQPSPFKSDGVYLISGGLGGVGVEIARHLLLRYRARLVLVGRTHLPLDQTDQGGAFAPSPDVGAKLTLYRELERLSGEVLYCVGDVGDEARMVQIAALAEARWSRPLDGVLHLAGLRHDGLLSEDDGDALSQLLHAKVAGTWALFQLVKARPDALFLTFSSVNGYFGGVAAGAYAAANAFLDHFALYARHAGPARTVNLAWTMWAGTGMSQEIPTADLGPRRGFRYVSPAQGLHSMLAALSQRETRLWIGLAPRNLHLTAHIHDSVQPLVEPVAFVEKSGPTGQYPEREELLSQLRVADSFRQPSQCAVQIVEILPRTPNGQIDLRQLIAEDTEEIRAAGDYAPPRTALEKRLARWWQELLQTPRIGLHDNFFALGGQSILAVQFVNRAREGGLQLKIQDLLTHQTISALAALLESPEPNGAWSPLVPIQPIGVRTPFFCVHPIMGVVFPYYLLAHNMDPEQPFYGLQSAGVDGELEPDATIEAMATRYLQAIKRVQATGPYLLGGWSFGAVVALEMAQQLASAGEEVGRLVILDTPILSDKMSWLSQFRTNLSLASIIGRELRPYVGDYLSLFDSAAKPMPKSEAVGWARQLTDLLNRDARFKPYSQPLIQAALQVYRNNLKAVSQYRPRPYGGLITLIKATEQEVHTSADLGWGDLAGAGVEVIPAPGNHMTLLREPHVQTVARLLDVQIKGATGF